MPRPKVDDATGQRISFSVVPAVTERIDRFLADQLQWSRTQAARFVAERLVEVDGRTARASRTLVRGDVVTIMPRGEQVPRNLRPHHIPLSILYEDEHLAVIDKPAGLVVHPAPGHWDDTLVNALVARGTTLSGGAEGRPGIVHRLDQDTSGVMVVARTEEAHRRLGAMLSARRIRRIYAALCWGHVDRPVVIEAPIDRHPVDRKRMAVREDGRAARTDVFPVARLGPVDLLRLELHTGRTHQIRVHLESVGHPVVGDPVYGGGGSRRVSGPDRALARRAEGLVSRQALHATILAFRHPATGEEMVFRAPWPEDLWPLMEAVVPADTLRERSTILDDLGFAADD